MKKLFVDTFSRDENWDRNKITFHKLFTWLTGYYIMFEESREDLIPQKIEKD